jgi:1-aminocyclopropane-1-carboxylate deaminase/D-cysteine desulfhydrase-like pyridoxal-dependent ACC family enzyme
VTVSFRAQALRERLAGIPTVQLTHLPTPVDECPRAAAALGIDRLWIKRDDQTGLAFGGNKARKLRYELAAAVQAGADVLVAGGGVSQSNHARQCAAAAARLGMKCILVLRNGPKGLLRQGNLFLDDILGAEVRLLDTDDVDEALAAMDATADELRRRGYRPWVVELEAPAVVAYVECALEIWEQLPATGNGPTHIFLASDGGTQAGILLGGKLLDAGWEVVAIRPHATDDDPRHVADIQVRQAAAFLGVDAEIERGEIISLQEYVGAGYGRMTLAAREAIVFLARAEGILLDPVYTSKAFAGLIDWRRTGRLDERSRVLFLHTGGTPALFAYEQDLTDLEDATSAFPVAQRTVNLSRQSI